MVLDLVTLAIAVAAAAGSTSVVALATAHGRRLDLAVVAAAGGGFLAVAAIGWLLGGLAWRDFFALVHLVYGTAVIGSPLAGVAAIGVALRSARRGGPPPSRPAAVALAGALCLAPVGWYATNVAPYDLAVERPVLAVTADRGGDDPIRIGIVSDIQSTTFGEHERDALDRLVDLEPDLIVIAGDTHQGSDADLERLLPRIRDLLGRLEAPHGVYAVRGNTERADEMAAMVEGTGVRFLLDESVTVAVGDRQVTVGGLEYIGHRRGTSTFALLDALQHGAGDDVRVLVSHTPDVLDLLEPDSRIDLVVSGHTHGGQIALPLIGPLVNITEQPDEVAGGGLHTVDGTAVYVSTGVGVERGHAPVVRFGTSPTITLLTIEG